MLDFTTSPAIVRAVVEGERLSLGHLVNPAFATELARIDPLPHQRLAVYHHLLPQTRLRFLLADDAGAGKTIMAGLYIREMLSRRLIRRVLIVPPAGLVGNWQRELQTLFNLDFAIVGGGDARDANPFAGPDGDRVIVSLDTLRGPAVFGRLREAATEPYDLVIFDEAHKLAADRGSDYRVRRTDRYRLAEALAGIPGLDAAWTLPWRSHHFLLLTATPHMGKDYPWFALWRLLDPGVFTTPKALAAYPFAQRSRYFLRRVKEEMLTVEGRPLYPLRVADTLGYALRQGEISEQTLYDRTTAYLETYYNRARLLNRSAAKLAMSVLQRRLASSTWALLRSLERRLAKLDELIAEVRQGRLSMAQLDLLQRDLSAEDDPFEAHTADEEKGGDGREDNEDAEDRLLEGVIAQSLADLETERARVAELLDLARRVYVTGDESKFVRLRDVLRDDRYADEKFLIFTEHRDTLEFLVERLDGLGYAGQTAQIHGGMDYRERERHVAEFRKPLAEGGARFLICTDAAGEGINLQFCWLMFNYDVPWNPARLEQRMGRIHRYGQQHDPVYIFNLVATTTREGRVLKTLLDKLEKIRGELGSSKVYDVIGRLFQEVSLKTYLDRALTENPDTVAAELGGRLTREQVEALAERERTLYGVGGEVARELPAVQAALQQETYACLLPGYVRQYLEQSAPLLGLRLAGDLDGFFTLRPGLGTVAHPVLAALDAYPPEQHHRLTVRRPVGKDEALWVHPGEPLFEQWRAQVHQTFGAMALRGARFTDPRADRPYVLHVARLTVLRAADPSGWAELARTEWLECRLVALRRFADGETDRVPVETLLLLQPAQGLPANAQPLALQAGVELEATRAQLRAEDGQRLAETWQAQRRARLVESERFIQQGFAFQEAELMRIHVQLRDKARAGNPSAELELAKIRQQEKGLTRRRDRALAVLRREPELIVPGEVEFIAHALVTPPEGETAQRQFAADVERIAMELVKVTEEAEGALVEFVHTPPLARAAGLSDFPGFDVLSHRPDGSRRHIEVKGRASLGAVEMTANEYGKACTLGDAYWLYAVFQCETARPQLHRIQNPAVALTASPQSNVQFSAAQIAHHTQLSEPPSP
ncbi:MAG: DUF3883 domain-containing protein [Candidatus Competibacteraceae bacterium]|nr:MAG: DUF3883 domain-containing protein [Candidatus Competibacteraceae bacterium]